MKFSKQQSKICIGILFLITVVWVLRKPAVYFPDSAGYLDMHIIRSAGYPTFLNILQFVFGAYFETGLIIVQLLLGLVAIYFFVKKMKTLEIIDNLLSVALTGVLLFPYFFNGQIANNVLSEALAYPLYLVLAAYYIAFFKTYDKKELLFSIPFLFLLLITRNQFIYMVLIGILMLVWCIITEKSWKKYRLLLLAFIALPFFTSIVDKTFHKIVHGHFVSTPWTGIHLIAPAYYVSDIEDEAVYTTQEEKEIFRKTYESLAQNKLNIHHLELDESETETSYYISHYSYIANRTVFKVCNDYFSDYPDNERFVKVNAITSDMAFPLVKNNFRKWFRLYYKNVIFAFGSLEYALLYFFLLGYCILMMFFKKDHAMSRIVALVVSFSILNVMAIAVGIHAVFRYTFYNDWVLFFAIFLLLMSWYKKKQVAN